MSGNNWQSPDWLLDRVRALGPIELDPCTVSSNPTGARRFITAEDDPCGLFSEWHRLADGGICFANPPYGRNEVGAWCAKILLEAERGCEIVGLLRGDTSTKWAHRLINAATLICFPPRIRFRAASGSPNFPNLIGYFGPRPRTFRRAFEDLGPIVAHVSRAREQRVNQRRQRRGECG